MKKYFLPLLALLAMPVVLTACSDDDDKTPTVNITTGQIPSKNVFVTIDGTYVGTADGVTELTGSVDPTATEHHLQLKCPSMFIVTPGTDGTPLAKSVPTFDVTVTTRNGQTTLSGNYSGQGYEITLTGGVTVNYASENDWKLNFEQTQTYFTNTFYKGKTFEFEFSKDYIFASNIHVGHSEQDYATEVEKSVNDFFDKLTPAFLSNSGITAARLVFNAETYELWFKDEESGEYVKDESEHRYLSDGQIIYFLDEPEFKKKQAEFFDLKPMGLDYTNTPMNFAQQTLVYQPGSAKEWSVTELRYYNRYEDKNAMFLAGSEGTFLSNWGNITDTETDADKKFRLFQEWEKDGKLWFTPFVLFEEVK